MAAWIAFAMFGRSENGVCERLERVDGRLERARAQSLTDESREVTRFVDLTAVEHGVDDGDDGLADSHLEHDGVRVAVGDVRVLGHPDPDPRVAAVRQVRGLDDRIAVQAHVRFLHDAA
jgi:hypothetical protein